MRRMLAATAVAAGCSHETVTVPIAPTASATGTTSTTGSVPAPVVSAPVDAGQPALVHHPMMGSDPVPPPAPLHCAGVDAKTTASAVLKKVGSNVELELTVTLPTGAPQGTFAGSQPPIVSGGLVVSSKLTQTTAIVRIRPGAQNSNGPIYLNQPFRMSVFFELACAPGPGKLQVDATLVYPPAAGAPVTIAIQSR
jgi:hypothetical protein